MAQALVIIGNTFYYYKIFSFFLPYLDKMKRALLVGVNYYGTQHLPGINLDLQNMSKLLISKGFEIEVLNNFGVILIN